MCAHCHLQECQAVAPNMGPPPHQPRHEHSPLESGCNGRLPRGGFVKATASATFMDMFFILKCSSQLVFSMMSSTGYLSSIASPGAEPTLLLDMDGAVLSNAGSSASCCSC